MSVAAALGGVAGSASAQTTANYLAFNPDGVGHILIVPYFSAQGGNATLLSIVNTDTVRGKALKVRFRGASNSDDIFDFQLFMSPGDVWSANVSSDATTGIPKLQTGDRSCTLPANVNQNFILTRLNPDLSGDELANEAREGYVEILNMGDIPSVSGTTSLWFATKHNSGGVAPCTASILESLTQGDTRLNNPTTGLMANWTIINVPQTTVWSGEAAAIEARVTGIQAGAGNNVYWPQTSTELTGGQVLANTADPLFRYGAVPGANYDLPDLSTPYTLATSTPIVQALELSDALAATVVAGEYISNASINATTDWIVSKPTRRYYAAVDYLGETPGEKLITNYNQFGETLSDYYRSKLTNADQDILGDATGNLFMGNAANGGKTWQACVQLTSVRFWDREEVSPTGSGIVISPGQPAPAPSLCGEVSSLGINSPVSPLGASVARFNLTLPSGLVDGWGRVTALNTFNGVNLGLPMLVTQYSKATNPAVSAGVSGTFGAAWNARVLERGYYYVR
jgi:hypothetical protein